MKIYKHITELQVKIFYWVNSLIITFLICFYYKTQVLLFFLGPILLFKQYFIFTHLTTGFWVSVKATAIITLLLTTPLLGYYQILFVGKGFYTFYINIIIVITLFTITLNFLSLLLCYKILIPILFSFFLNFENLSGPFFLILEARIDEYIDFLLNMFGFFSLATMCPLLVIAGLGKLGNNFFIRKILYFFIISAVLLLSPPDPFFHLIITPILIIISEIYLIIINMIISYLSIVIK